MNNIVRTVTGKQNYKYTVISLTTKVVSSWATLIHLFNKTCGHDSQLVISFYYNLSSH